jgi:pyruvate,water dikinase
MAGTKALNLQALLAHGLPVPLTFCVTLHAYRSFMKENRLGGSIRAILRDTARSWGERSREITALIEAARPSPRLAEEIARVVLSASATVQWAVRSSSDMEDLAGASFAGLHESFLHVKGSAAPLVAAVRACWASLWSERAIAYRERNGFRHGRAHMGVLIQEMVDARYAGVLFTEVPDRTARDTMLMEYCEGTGEGLVSGKVVPRRVALDRKTHEPRRLGHAERAGLAPDELRKVARLGLAVEALFGRPQDIEWAFDGADFLLLQARPITAIAPPSPPDLSRLWTRANIGEVLPGVVTPLTWAVFGAVLAGRRGQAARYAPAPGARDGAIALFYGRAYVRVDAFLDSFCYLPYVTPEVMGRLLGLRLPANAVYTRPSGAPVRLAQGLFFLAALRLLPRLAFEARRLPPIPAAGNRPVERLFSWCASCFRLHILCTAYAAGVFAVLDAWAKKWLPHEEALLVPLVLKGREDLQTAAQGRFLARLARHVEDHPGLRTLLLGTHSWPALADTLPDVSGGIELSCLLDAFLDANGARTAGEFELALPRWREDPSFVIMALRAFLGARPGAASVHEEAAHEEAIGRIAAALPRRRRALFFRVLASYGEFITMRENMKYRLMEGYAEIRRHFLARGEELRSRGVLSAREDVFFLTPAEIALAAEAGDAAGRAAAFVRERKEEKARMERIAAPHLYPDEAHEDATASAGALQEGLSGIGCSPGVAEGRARVLDDPSGAPLLAPGEVLVAPHTDPGWTPLFLVCAGVVTESGGFLSHGATVAREYGVPAVAGVPEATRKIRTGDLVRVDGARGIVTIVAARTSGRAEGGAK